MTIKNIFITFVLLLVMFFLFRKKEKMIFKYQHNVEILDDSLKIAMFQNVIDNYGFTIICQDNSKHLLRSEDQNSIYSNISYCINDYKSNIYVLDNSIIEKELLLKIKIDPSISQKQDTFFLEMWSFNSVELASNYFELLKIIAYKCNREDIWTYPILFRNKILIPYVESPLRKEKGIGEKMWLFYQATQHYLDNFRDLEVNGIDIVKKFTIPEEDNQKRAY